MQGARRIFYRMTLEVKRVAMMAEVSTLLAQNDHLGIPPLNHNVWIFKKKKASVDDGLLKYQDPFIRNMQTLFKL